MFSKTMKDYTIIYKDFSFYSYILSKLSAAGLFLWERINTFPHIDAFSRLCSRQFFENIVTKEEIPFATMFSTLSYRLSGMDNVQSRLLQNCRMWERVNQHALR